MTLLTAIVGGAVGVLLSAFARGLAIPSDVRAHDAAIADRDEALATWTADRSHALRRECEGVRNKQNPPMLPEGMDQLIVDARGQALHEWRDEARRAQLDVANILATEGWAHRLYRRLTKRAAPALTTPERATPVLDAWRKPSEMGGQVTWPDDATKRTLDDAIDTMPVTGP